MRSLVFGVMFVAALARGSASADDGSLSDLLGPREVAVGEALRGSATGATAIDLNPSGLPLNRELVFEGGYGYRASDSASLIGASACDSTNAMPGCFFYYYAGANPELEGMSGTRTTHVGGVSLSRLIVPRVAIGATTKYYRFSTDMTGEADASGTTFDLGATVRVTDILNVGLAAQNLYSTNESPQFPRAFGGGIYARPLPALAISFDVRWRLEGDNRAARYGGGAELFLRSGQNAYPLRAGALRDNGLDKTYVSGGLGFASMRWAIDFGGRREVGGGDENLVVASMRFYGPRLAPPPVQ